MGAERKAQKKEPVQLKTETGSGGLKKPEEIQVEANSPSQLNKSGFCITTVTVCALVPDSLNEPEGFGSMVPPTLATRSRN